MLQSTRQYVNMFGAIKAIKIPNESDVKGHDTKFALTSHKIYISGNNYIDSHN